MHQQKSYFADISGALNGARAEFSQATQSKMPRARWGIKPTTIISKNKEVKLKIKIWPENLKSRFYWFMPTSERCRPTRHLCRNDKISLHFEVVKTFLISCLICTIDRMNKPRFAGFSTVWEIDHHLEGKATWRAPFIETAEPGQERSHLTRPMRFTQG